MTSLTARLQALEPTIVDICKISGIAGASVGVVSHGEVVYKAGFGFSDVAAGVVPDEHTIYTLGSLTKGLVSAMMGILVQDKKLSWDTRLRDILPDFSRDEKDPLVNVTITDLLSHRSGLAAHDSLWFLSDNRIVMKRSDAVPMINYLPTVHPLLRGYCYNNFGYEIAGQVIEKLSGQSLDEFFRERIAKPLALTRTYFGTRAGETHEAKAYMTLKDGSPVKIGLPFANKDSLMAAAGGARASVSDLLALYAAYMEAGNHELEFDTVKIADNNPFKQIGKVWEPAINFPFRVLREYSYSLGWCRTQLPGPLALANSETDRSQLPIVGKGTPSRLAIYHEGAISGSVTFAALFPETNSSVVVLSNSTPLNYDGPRFIAELLIETLIGGTDANIQSILQRSRNSAEEMKGFVDGLQKELTSTRTVHESVRQLEEYTGRFYNAVDTFFFEIRSDGGGLKMRFYGVEEEEFALYPYQEDSFTWLPAHDELASRGRYYDYPKEYYIIKFGTDEGKPTEITTLTWQFDSAVEAPEKLRKKDGSAVRKVEGQTPVGS